MESKFLDHNNRELKQWRRRRQWERQKSKKVNKQNNFARSSRIFCTFLSRRCKTPTWTFHAPALWSRWTQGRKFRFLCLYLDTVLSDSTPENFAKIWYFKWNWIRLMKSQTVRIHFLSDVLGLSSRNFATMARWHKDLTSPLYRPWNKALSLLCNGSRTCLLV